MNVIDDRTFRFKSGYTIRVREHYDPRFYQLTRDSYREENPPPEPPLIEKQVPVKSGMKTITRFDYQDETYLRAYSIWEMQMYTANSDTVFEMAIDPDSIDMAVVEAGRAWAAQNGISVPRDDAQAYIRFVVTPPSNTPGKKEEESELLKFYRWLNEMGGPSEPLVNQFLDTFRAKVPGKTDLQRVPATQ